MEYQMSDEGIIALVHNCPNIERLSVFELYKLSDVSLTQVAAVLGDTLVSPDLILSILTRGAPASTHYRGVQNHFPSSLF